MQSVSVTARAVNFTYHKPTARMCTIGDVQSIALAVPDTVLTVGSNQQCTVTRPDSPQISTAHINSGTDVEEGKAGRALPTNAPPTRLLSRASHHLVNRG